jgi:hypothetical protein
MGKRYIVLEEKSEWGRLDFIVLKKCWIFYRHLGLFSSKEEAISFVISMLKKDESYKRVVFDTKHDLKTEVMF